MKKIVTLLTAVLVLAACKDDAFLTEHPKYFYTPDNAFSTQDQVDQVLLSCYAMVRDIQSMRSEGAEFFVFRCGNGTDMYDVTNIRHSYQFNDYSIITPEHKVFKYIFGYWYKMISYSNLALYASGLENIDWDSEESLSYAQAQAHFFRAWAYRNLGEEFGGAFIVPDLCTEPRFNFERSTRVETYQYAIDELEGCLDDFPETGGRGRIVRGAAQRKRPGPPS